MKRWIGPLLAAAVVVAVWPIIMAHSDSAWAQPKPPQASKAGPAAQTLGKGAASARAYLEPGISVGAAATYDNLAVYPVYSTKQQQIGEFTTLPLALEAKTADVRERGSGGQVSTVVIENRGSKPILVLAGTIIKGGNQDRIIGQDFVISARKTIPVDAFCVEQGRWQGTRAGKHTLGRFAAVGTLAARNIRAAGQFKANQGQVWAEVAKVNQDHRKKTSTGTLMATVDDKQLTAKRMRLAAQAKGGLARDPHTKQVVGLAYAIDGKVRGVRWFMNHKMFELYAEPLLQTAALEALTAQARAKAQGKPSVTVAAHPAAVRQFVQARKAAKRTVRKKTAAGNVNTYRFSDDGYSSDVKYRPRPAAPPAQISAEYY